VTRSPVARRGAFAAADAASVSPIFASDLFTDTAGVTLPSHSMTAGGPWVAHGSYNNNGVISSANRARSGSATLTFGYYATTPPGSADYSVAADLVVVSANGSMGVAGRISTSADTMYFTRYNSAASRWELFSLVAGAATSLGTFSQALTVGNTYNVKLSMVGTAISVLIDGVSRISVTNSAVTVAGRAGLRGTGGASGGTDATSYHLDNFVASA
jgi:hypothetical protein